ncbi:VOC family protein [Sphingobium sp.]|uniref:VOC family protein n=1 Tax=Sphingobium sp. TaxID=1912891 RepID=UPI0028BD1B36|nr:VOC family protein [Sphingobium sp.]
MFTHVMVGTNDLGKARAFYDAVFQAIGAAPGVEFHGRAFYSHKGTGFGVGAPADGNAATYANGGTVGFAAVNQDAVDAWHAAGLVNGGVCDGTPGHRPLAPGNTYAAYLRDPDGNKLCASCQLG